MAQMAGQSQAVSSRSRSGRQTLLYVLLALMIAVVGGSLTTWLFVNVGYWESEHIAAEFRLEVNQLSDRVKEGIADCQHGLNATKLFFQASDFVEREEFETFAAPTMQSRRFIRGLAWVPVVERGERGGFEQAARADGLPDFAVRQWAAGENSLAPAADCERYFPIQYLIGNPDSKLPLGLDLASIPQMAERLARSAATGTMDYLEAPDPLKRNEHLHLLVLPLIESLGTHDGGSSASMRLQGYLVMEISPVQLVMAALEDKSFPWVSFELRSLDVGLTNVLARMVDGRMASTAGPNARPETDERKLIERLAIPIGNGNWELFCWPTPGLYAAHLNSQRQLLPWLVLMFTGISLIFLLFLMRRDSVIAHIVARRTEQLTEANLRLESENRQRRKAELALRQSQERYKAIIEDQTELICRCMPDGTLTFVNEAYCRYFNVRREEMLGRSFLHLLLEDDRDPVLRHLGSLAPENPQATIECRVVLRGGAIRWQQWTDRALFDERGNFSEIQAVGRDVTSLRQALDEERKFVALVENSHDFIAITDLAGRIRFLNRAGHKLVGFEASISVETAPRIEDLYLPGFSTEFHRQLLEDVVRHGHWAGEVQFQHRRNGMPIVMQLNASIQRGSDSDGEETIAWIARDITERHRALEALRESEERYRQIVETANEGIWIVDSELRTTFVNQELLVMLGYAWAEMIGRSPFDFVLAEDRPELAEKMARRGLGHAEKHDQRFLRKDGQPLWAIISATPLYDKHGGYLGALAMFTDITERKRAEMALSESETRYKSIVENSHDAIVLHNIAGRITYLSPAADEVLGWNLTGQLRDATERSLSPQSILDQVHPEDFERVFRNFVDSLSGQRGANLLYRLRTLTGDWKWLSHSWSPIHEGDQISSIISVIRDVTDLKRAEAALAENAERVRLSLQNADVGLWDWNLAENEIYFVRHWAEILGYASHEIGRHREMWDALVHPDDRERVMAEMTSHLEGRTPIYESEHRYRARNGEYRWMVQRGVVIDRDAYGRPLRAVGMHMDITPRKQAEEELTRLATAAEQAAEAMIITDDLGRIEYVNPAYERLSGNLRNEVIGQPMHPILTGENSSLIFKAIWQTITQGEVWRGKFSQNRRNGEPYEVVSTFSPVLDEKGRIINFAIVQLDITHEINLERKLQQAERLSTIGQTIMGVAHHLKNILAGLRGSAEMIEREIFEVDNERLEEIWPIYKRNTERLARLSQEMLDYAKLKDLKPTPTNINHLVAEIVKQCSLMPCDRAIDFRFQPDFTLTSVLCDAEKMHDAILNLVCNAIDALDATPRPLIDVSIQHDSRDDTAQITVADNGPGVPPENLRRIFDPFFTTKGSQGSGLGLAVTQRTIYDHGGTIGVTSEPGSTVFTIRIPCSQGAARVSDAHAGSLQAVHGAPAGPAGDGHDVDAVAPRPHADVDGQMPASYQPALLPKEIDEALQEVRIETVEDSAESDSRA